MAIPKVCGIETEYGIQVRGADNNPVAASSVLVNAYVASTTRKVGWDFEDEHPGNDARGFTYEDVFPPEVDTHLVNAVLTNGARYYVDHAHPEVSTPECLTAREAVVYDRAAEEIVRTAPDTILDVSYAADPATAAREWTARPELASVPAIMQGRVRVLKAPYFLAPSPRMAAALTELEAALGP